MDGFTTVVVGVVVVRVVVSVLVTVVVVGLVVTVVVAVVVGELASMHSAVSPLVLKSFNIELNRVICMKFRMGKERQVTA